MEYVLQDCKVLGIVVQHNRALGTQKSNSNYA